MGQTEKRKKMEKSDQVAAKKTKWTKKPGKDQDGEKKPFKKDFKSKDFKSKKQNFNKNRGKAEGEIEGENQKEKKEPLSRKEVKVQRKIRDNPNYYVEMEMKKLWGKLRNAGTSLFLSLKNKISLLFWHMFLDFQAKIELLSETSKEKIAFVDQIFALVKKEGKSMEEFAFAHDTTRVLQSCLQSGIENSWIMTSVTNYYFFYLLYIELILFIPLQARFKKSKALHLRRFEKQGGRDGSGKICSKRNFEIDQIWRTRY